MRYMLRWWETLGRPERIVAMSLAVGGAVAVANSTVWAIAVSYMTHEKAKVALVAAQIGTVAPPRGRDSGNVTGNVTDSVSPAYGIVHAGS